MDFQIKTTPTIYLIGKCLKMSLANYKTVELWTDFMKTKHQIKNIISTDLYSVKMYENDYFKQYNPNIEFTKWACAKVEANTICPDGFENLKINQGLYAMFIYKGLPQNANAFFTEIFTNCIPNSNYKLVNKRLHFEVLGKKFNKDSEDSEEEVWVPIMEK